MIGEMQAISQIAAFEAERAVRARTHRIVGFQPDARYLSFLAMAGEATTMHAAAFGPRRGRPRTYIVADPRNRKLQGRLFRWLGRDLVPWVDDCYRRGTFPQMIVPAGAHRKRLEIIADRFRFSQDAAIRQCGEYLTYFTDRTAFEGQQSLLVASEFLSDHYVTGLEPSEEAHLGVLLAWIEPPANRDIFDVTEEVEQEVYGAKTDPAFDRQVLEPLVTAFNQARRNRDRRQMEYLTARIREVLLPHLNRTYRAAQQAVRILSDSAWPEITAHGGLNALVEAERQYFRYWMRGRLRGYFLPLRDRPLSATRKLSTLEAAANNYQAVSRLGDGLGLAEARLRGLVVEGVVRNLTVTKVPRRTIYRFELHTLQEVIQPRVGQSVYWIDDPRLEMLVTGLQVVSVGRVLSLEITGGMRAVGPPAVGQTLSVTEDLPEWGRDARRGLYMKYRMKERRAAAAAQYSQAGGIP